MFVALKFLASILMSLHKDFLLLYYFIIKIIICIFIYFEYESPCNCLHEIVSYRSINHLHEINY